MNPKQFRQGDVYLVAVDAAPRDAKTVKTGARIILAYGEATGHHHSVSSRGCQLLERTETDEQFLRIMAKSGVELTHEEHATITLPPGDYKIVHQREYTSADMAPARVAD